MSETERTASLKSLQDEESLRRRMVNGICRPAWLTLPLDLQGWFHRDTAVGTNRFTCRARILTMDSWLRSVCLHYAWREDFIYLQEAGVAVDVRQAFIDWQAAQGMVSDHWQSVHNLVTSWKLKNNRHWQLPLATIYSLRNFGWLSVPREQSLAMSGFICGSLSAMLFGGFSVNPFVSTSFMWSSFTLGCSLADQSEACLLPNNSFTWPESLLPGSAKGNSKETPQHDGNQAPGHAAGSQSE